MKKEIFVNARFLTQPIAGTQRFAIELSLELGKYLPSLIYLAPDRILHKDIADKLNVQITGRSKNGLFWEQIELPFFLRKNGNPLLINLCNIAPLFYNNNLVSILDLSFYHHPEWFSRKYAFLYNLIIPRIAANAKRIVTISEYSKQDISKTFRISLEKIDLVYPNVPNVFLKNYPTVKKNIYGKYILAVSSLDPRKNFPSLIQAFKEANLVDTKLVIVGVEGKVFANNNLKELIENDDSIVFTGYISDEELIGLYKNAKIFVYPSFFEGFGLPPLEAMACGCPTLVSNTTSLPEVCGEASEYVDPYSIRSIREGIEKVLYDESLAQRLREKGKDRVKYFNAHKSAQSMANTINSLNL
ncbi:glycosyltransferase family 1 protein [Spirosoma sp. KCTC 42546]|uniref:glycosyltransferase family 4 protein n=1 Tax=Spirosoma sp. KCTC 42546 TaxID=2520506 RepID=UPI00143D112B|nr:glycosyltransferase family 1 protein [Spirosoma sp. KCTC 42546]